nr:MAG TPA: hypothetical protein [Caudoviricetes sp.]
MCQQSKSSLPSKNIGKRSIRAVREILWNYLDII